MSDDVIAPAVPDGIDLAGVRRFLGEHVRVGDGPLTVELIAGGMSNLTYALTSAAGSWVLRRPPLGHVLPTAHDMTREYTVLTALRESGVPVPRTLALCTDPAVTGAPFYLMERCEGIVPHETLPPGYAETAAERRRMCEALVETLARLHRVDWQAVGLGEFGRPAGFVARQVRRWGEQWDRSKTRELPDLERLRALLAAQVPESPPPAIVHGDYRLGNLMFAADDPGQIVAIFDWEMSTIGDPLTDLGWLCCYWAEPDDPPEVAAALQPFLPMLAPGFMTRAELADRYADLSGLPVKDIDFYTALASFKLAVVCEGIHARYLASETRGDGFDLMGDRVPHLVRLALGLVG